MTTAASASAYKPPQAMTPTERTTLIVSTQQRILAGEDLTSDELRNAIDVLRFERGDTSKAKTQSARQRQIGFTDDEL